MRSFFAWMRQGHFVSWLVSLTIVCSVVYKMFFSEEHTDYRIYKAAAAVVGSSTSIYDVALPCGRCGNSGLTYGYLYPPLLALVFKIYAMVSPFPMELLWLAVNAVAIFVVASCLYLLGIFRAGRIPLFGIYLALWPPTMHGLVMGQIHLLVLALLAVFVVAIDRRAGKTAGVSLALAIHLKITPILLFPVLLSRNGRSARMPFVVTMISLTLFSALFSGLSSLTRFLELASTLGHGDQYWNHVTNFTPSKLFSNFLFGLNSVEALLVQRLLVIAAIICSIVHVLRSRSVDTMILTSRLIVLMVLASPIVWYHHLVWFAIPLAVGLKVPGLQRKMMLAALMLILTFSFYVHIYVNSFQGYDSIVGSLMLAVVGVVLLTLLRHQPVEMRVASVLVHSNSSTKKSRETGFSAFIVTAHSRQYRPGSDRIEGTMWRDSVLPRGHSEKY